MYVSMFAGSFLADRLQLVTGRGQTAANLRIWQTLWRGTFTMNVSVCASPFLAERLQEYFGAGGGGGGGVNAGALIRHCNRVNSAVKFALTPHCKTTMRVNAETLQN